MKIIPLNDRVLVKSTEAEEKTQIAEVIAVGDSEDIKVKVGQKILHDKYAGTAVKADGSDYLILSAGDILAIIE